MNFTAIKTRYLQCSFLFLLMACQTLNAAIIHVDADLTAGDGLTWATAYGDLQTAIDGANSGDEVWVKNGTYIPTSGTDRNISIELKSGVELYGGFSGGESLRILRDKINTGTILSGEITSGNSYSVVYCNSSIGSSTIIDGFIITGGIADGSGLRNNNGGGLFNNGASPTIRYCQFLSNSTINEGGAIYNAGLSGATSSPEIFQCTFISNDAKYGGAIYNNANLGTSSPNILSCLFDGNQASATAGTIFSFGKGGGNSNPQITNCVFSNNSSSVSAGSVYNLADGGTSISTITNCTFYQNSANTGGAVYVNESNGGNGEAIITNSIFWENSGLNPTFNMSKSGGGTPTISISFSLIDATDCADVIDLGTDETFNCTGTNMLFNIDPSFVSAGSDFRLMSTSLAINKGGGATVATDKDELPRTVASIVDLGAYENQSPILPIELVSFDARFEKDQVALYWSTLSEKGNDYFTIERSQDGHNFTAIERINGAGDSSIPLTYRTYDQHPESGINYYRLKQTDYNGNFSYSHIDVVTIQDGNIRLYPNPVTDHLYIATNGFENGETRYSIVNINGKEVIRGMIELNDNLAVLQVNEIQSLPPGSYFVKVFHEHNGGFSKKFIKVRM